MSPILISFVLCLLGFTLIGILSARQMKATTEDYLVASRDVPPWLVGLSAVATNNSGYMFIGLIGFTYAYGLSAIWLTMAWVAGDYMAWFFVHKQLRARSEASQVTSVPGFLGADPVRGHSRLIAVVAGVMTLAFLSVYAAAQFKAGSKALFVMFGWDQAVGAVLGAVLVVAYCFAGGIRASIWTDAAQSVVMIGAMTLLVLVEADAYGGPSELMTRLGDIDPGLVDWVPPDASLGLAVYVLGWLGAGLGVIGQPHIMIRAMTVQKPEQMPRVRRIYFGWYIPFSLLAWAVGLYARVAFADGGFDQELALPMIARDLLPGALVGLILAALFAATMSTADSQILSCSAAVTQDIFPKFKASYFASKVATIGVAGLALTVALGPEGSVFNLVVMAWSALGAGLGPLMLLRALGVSLSPGWGVAVILSGVGTVLAWKYGAGLGDALYEVLPGITVGLLVGFVGSRLEQGAR